ncbi:hypothetical protein GQ457_14G019080 [Hibiscus cannabinus]
MGIGLDKWFRKLTCNKKVTVKELKSRLAQLNAMSPTDDVLGDIVDTKLALNIEADKEELYWEQRARANWLRNGDRNTSFFHRFASHRRKRNRVDRLVDDTGNSFETNDRIMQAATDYFKVLFESNGCNPPGRILEGIQPCIDPSLNGDLDKSFSNEEVLTALKSMCPLKASGEDGLGAVFYQRFWHIVGKDVSEFCIGVLIGEYNLKDINHTRIVMIPKIDNPQHMAQFRPISLVMGASVKTQSGSSSVFMAEAKAAIHGLTFAADLGFHHVILESDLKTLVRKVVNKEDDFSEIRVFCFTPRQGNRVAHAIAAIGRKLGFDQDWIEEVPPEALSMVEDDQRFINKSS